MTNTELQQAYLRYLTYKGCIERYGVDVSDPKLRSGECGQGTDAEAIMGRIEHELATLEKAGFAGYFLLVQDILRFCRDRDIPTGPGRGSVCGSAVAYVIGITDVDPLRFDIPFERFLHLERIAQPDIDLDLCQSRRGEVIQYLRDTYGSDSVAQIITFTPMAAKGVVTDVCRVLHVDEVLHGVRANETGMRLSKAIPEGSGADQTTLSEFMESDEGRSFAVELESLAIPFENRTISVKDTCMALEGLVRQPSVHAAGVVVADRPLIELAPLYKKNKDAELVIQYDMRDAEELGLLKLDVLGLRTVTVIGEAEALVRRNDPSFSIKSVPLDDPDTFRLLAAGDTGAVFQLEGDGITAACTGMRPDRFEDIIALIALYRPGPMEQLGSYFRRKHGEEEVEYVHPLLEPVLKRSYGLIVYQEQVMGIVRALGGYSAGEADMFRKAIGKKLVPLIEAEIAKFVDRAIANGHDEHIVRSIGDQIFFFGRYGFNLGHATGYAFITYWTAYLKANFPTEFFTANLNSQVGNLDNISRLLRDANKHGISIEPPDINESGVGFTHVAVNKIRFGLGGVKGLGDTAVQDILEERDSEEKNCYAGKRVTRQKPDGKEYAATIRAVTRIKNRPHPYADAHDFCKRLPHLTIVMKRNLAIAGAFGADPDYRRRLYGALEQINTLAKKGKPFHVSEYDGPIMPEAELIKKEREIIGLYLTKHPLELYMRDIEQYGATINGSFDDLHASCVVAGLVESKRVHQASSGEMAWVTLENEIDGMVDVTIFNKTWMRVRDKIVDGAVIVAMCKKEHHPKFGWGLKASDVRVLDRARSAAKSITVTVPVADASDMIELARLTDTTGVPLRVVIGTQDRWVSIKCNRKINMTPAVDSYLAQLDMKINNDVIDIEDLGYTSVSPFVGAGPSRQSLYNRPLIKKALELFDAQAECTLIKVST